MNGVILQPKMRKDKRHFAAVIPARGGSKGIRLKNIKLLCGQPLLSWVLRAIIDSNEFDSIWVSTENADIARVAAEWGAQVHHRSPEAAQDNTLAVDTMTEFAEHHPEVDILAMIQCTSPLLHPWMLHEPVKMIREHKYDSVFAVSRRHLFRWKEIQKPGELTVPENLNPSYRPNRQAWPGELYENGQFYMFTRELLDKRLFQGGKVSYYELPEASSVDIDTDLDWSIVEQRVTKFGYFGLEKKKNVKLVVFDVDGVITDDEIHISDKGEEFCSYHRSDLEGIKLLKKAGIEVRLLTENSNAPSVRLISEKIECMLEIGVKNKVELLTKWVEELNLDWQQVTYMGNDETDIPAMRKSGLGAAPADAQTETRYAARFIATNRGGRGAVRQFCDYILRLSEK
ncbi:N-acylneuraminate cytidylyltransferase-like [Saccoglossus kowalevskii]|uniref:N-acylneuraminate cytidylyltransferase n=1 Tax=Saccoglossus kowalevskii TaxID=10224 RepID=A0ABM0GJG5_SACKO|nr:PREDICTED: N-acylneuraminate cytidylyltransferase-like [Saccoglossus kowalevskii]